MTTGGGFLFIDKPSGITSHDVVDWVREITGVERVGHSGTLDPFATGLLIVGVGRDSTKRLGTLLGADKEYVATVRLGATSDTFDRDGDIHTGEAVVEPSFNWIVDASKEFVGKIQQVPPIYSAKKVGGKKFYELARRGKEIHPEPVSVEVFEFKVLHYDWPRLTMRVRCSSGTYIRSLANDVGQKLGCGGYLEELRRTSVGRLSVREATSLAALTAENWEQRLVSNV